MNDFNSVVILINALIMKPIQISDLDNLTSIWADPKVTRFLPSRGVPIPRERTEKSLTFFIRPVRDINDGEKRW